MRGRAIAAAALLLAAAGGCALLRPSLRPPRGRTPETVKVLTTGYCPCRRCCGWTRTWYGRPVIAAGPDRGRPKRVGITASGTRARPGTVAADTAVFPFGTLVEIPGYGMGIVEDRGGAVRGLHLDLYFTGHADALRWGRRRLTVRVWRPDPGGPAKHRE